MLLYLRSPPPPPNLPRQPVGGRRHGSPEGGGGPGKGLEAPPPPPPHKPISPQPSPPALTLICACQGCGRSPPAAGPDGASPRKWPTPPDPDGVVAADTSHRARTKCPERWRTIPWDNSAQRCPHRCIPQVLWILPGIPACRAVPGHADLGIRCEPEPSHLHLGLTCPNPPPPL